jgi:hypothetical protein
MDFLLLSDEFAVRLQAGAFGSLLAVVSETRDHSVPATRRWLGGWIFAIFGAPIGSALMLSLLGPIGMVGNATKRDAELITAFFCGIVGWKIVHAINLRANSFRFGRDKKTKGNDENHDQRS